MSEFVCFCFRIRRKRSFFFFPTRLFFFILGWGLRQCFTYILSWQSMCHPTPGNMYTSFQRNTGRERCGFGMIFHG
ncbi:hypothetical protein DFS34DRAFT_635429, partial [Phlyctochytrium arcticum]